MTSNKRIQDALDATAGTESWNRILAQDAFNLLRNSPLVDQHIREALNRWADTVLGPETNGNGDGRWGDDGGENLD